MKTVIYNARIVTAERVIEYGVCAYENGKISYVGKERVSGDYSIDAHGRYLIPGFVDLHCHGGNGLEFMDGDVDAFERIARFHLAHGTTAMLATTLAASDTETENALKIFAAYEKKYPNGSLKGVHLEGPWLNPLQCGAQNAAYMKTPNAEELRALKERYPFVLRVSAAPELPESNAFARVGKETGLR